MSLTFLTDKDEVLRYSEQKLTEEQKAQARENIGVGAGGGSGVEVTAKPGQLIRVKEVDENGNPTAWEAVPWGYTEGGMVEILAECQPPYIEDEDMFVVTEGVKELSAGEMYIVNWNGTEYPCVGQDMSAMTAGAVALGNVDAIMGTGDSGEPFMIAVALQEGIYSGAIIPLDGTTELTLSIYHNAEIPHPIPGELLPEGVPYLYKDYILEETDAVETTDPSFGKTWRIVGAPSLSVGETYTVIYNGVPYDCVCQPGEILGMSMANGGFVLGNSAAVGGANTGEPFAMLILPAYQIITNMDLTDATSVRIGIMGKVGHKVDDHCLPDNVARVFTVKAVVGSSTSDGWEVSIDKTFDEIRAKAKDGNTIVRILLVDEDGNSDILPLQYCYSDVATFSLTAMQEGNDRLTETIWVKPDNTALLYIGS